MKIAVVVGWILLVLEAALVISMFVLPNVGDDAAGSGMARGFAIVLGPLLLLSGGLFIWGQRGGPRFAFWAGFAIMAIPLAFIVQAKVVGAFNSLEYKRGKALYGKFKDERLTNLARAIEAEDTAAVRAMIAGGPVDFTSRSELGRTILGRAIEFARGYNCTPKALEAVRMLLAAGGKPLPNVVGAEYYGGDIDAHLLVPYVFGGNTPNTPPLLDMLLEAGADPNAKNSKGETLYFTLDTTLPKLEVLAKHGADFTILETTREDRAGYTAAMTWAELGNFEIVSFFLDQGVRADYGAPDSNSLRQIVALKQKEDKSDSAMTAVVQRLGSR